MAKCIFRLYKQLRNMGLRDASGRANISANGVDGDFAPAQQSLAFLGDNFINCGDTDLTLAFDLRQEDITYGVFAWLWGVSFSSSLIVVMKKV